MVRTDNGITPNLPEDGPISITNNQLTFKANSETFLDIDNQQLTIDNAKFLTATFDTFSSAQGAGILIGQKEEDNKIFFSLAVKDNDSGLFFDNGYVFVSVDDSTIKITENNVALKISQVAGNALSVKNDGVFAEGLNSDDLNVILGNRQPTA
jgi:hypothetical protein